MGNHNDLMTHSNDLSHRLREPSSMHAFNRYELKYLVPTDQIEPVRQELTQRMQRDPHAGPRGYGEIGRAHV